MERWEQTSEKKFDRAVRNADAECTSVMGVSRYATYVDKHGNAVARIDTELDVHEINTNYKPGL